ncbi:MAG TPA: hypothetical protein VKV41_08850 [Methylomirabilota bacterium]|nr:hypothetical protein [Methylomirabilota bacterium]
MTSRPSRRVLLLALLVTAITVASLWPALDGQFLNWGENFLRNESYRELGSAPASMDGHDLAHGPLHPADRVTFGLNYALSGMSRAATSLSSWAAPWLFRDATRRQRFPCASSCG